ncbi:MAG: hypothetical protein H8E66_32245 [Planctomycetes bacterium]|nr:hypothetical protein [Planctomycetota bacterium]
MSLRFYFVMVATIQLSSLVSSPPAAGQNANPTAWPELSRQAMVVDTQRKRVADSVLEHIVQLTDPKQSLEKDAAIRTLGKLRAVNAIPFLLKNIEFAPIFSDVTVSEPPTRQLFPCVDALIEIDGLAVPQILAALKAAESNRQLRLLAVALGGIYRDADLAKYRIQQEFITGVRDDDSRGIRNLRFAIQFLQSPNSDSWSLKDR